MMPQDQFPIQCPIQGPVQFVPCHESEIQPLIEHLVANVPVAAPIIFPRGTVLPDGRLDLCKQNLGPGGCQKVVKALENNNSIRSLLLGTDGIGDEGAAFVGELLAVNPNLQVVYLGCNGITSMGVQSLAGSLSDNSYILGLWLKRNPIGDRGVEMIARLLAKNHSLRVLDLVNTGIGKHGTKLLCQSLMLEECGIERLYLGGNSLDYLDAMQLSEVLRTNRKLKSLFLNVGALADDGAIAIADSLLCNQTIQELGLASNGITARGVERLLDAVTTHPTLTHLDLGYSPSTLVLQAKPNLFGDEGGVLVGKMLAGNSILRCINLAKTGIGRRGRDAIEAGLLENRSIISCTIDGGFSDSIRARLLTNQNNSGATLNPSNDVTLIRSVYRTAK